MKNRIFLILIIVFLVSFVSAENNKVYILNLNYDNGIITLKEKIVKYGFYPDRKIQPGKGYRMEIVSVNEDVLYFFNFEIPLKMYVDVTNVVTNELSGGMINLHKTDFALILPYFKEAKEAKIYDMNNNKILTIDLEEKLSKKGMSLLWLIPIVLVIALIIFLFRLRKRR